MLTLVVVLALVVLGLGGYIIRQHGKRDAELGRVERLLSDFIEASGFYEQMLEAARVFVETADMQADPVVKVQRTLQDLMSRPGNNVALAAFRQAAAFARSAHVEANLDVGMLPGLDGSLKFTMPPWLFQVVGKDSVVGDFDEAKTKVQLQEILRGLGDCLVVVTSPRMAKEDGGEFCGPAAEIERVLAESHK